MATTDRKILEYALKGLEAERDLILSEIEELRARLADTIAPSSRRRARRSGKAAKRRRQRAVKGVKREVAKKATAVKKQATSAIRNKAASAKKTARKMTDEQRKRLSETMKDAWARRKNRAKG